MALTRIPESRWDQLKAGDSLAVWVRVPNPEMSPQLYTGDFIDHTGTSTGAPAFRLRHVGQVEVVIPRADIDEVRRQMRNVRARLVSDTAVS